MQNHEDVYLSLNVRANQRASAGYFRADHLRHLFAADRFVIVIERRREYPSYREGTYLILTNHLVKLDSYASVPRQGAWLECGTAMLSRATGTRRAPLEVGEWEPRFPANDILSRVSRKIFGNV